MVSAMKVTAIRKTPTPPPPPVDSVEITLDPAEASYILQAIDAAFELGLNRGYWSNLSRFHKLLKAEIGDAK